MRSPIIDGYVSSEFGLRNGTLHAGIDIRTRAGYGDEVQASFAGTVEKVVSGRKHGDRSRKNELAPYRTGNGVIIRNPDGEAQLYGHVNPSVKKGQKVKEGQVLGKVDNSGNTTGPHVHYEEWTAGGKLRNPRVSFKHFKVTPGKGKKAVAPATSTPTPSKPKPSTKLSASVKEALTQMGLPATTAGVVTYQKAHGLHPDGDWGAVTQRYREWVIALQKYLNLWKRVRPKLVVDGYRGSITKRAEVLARSGATARVPYRPPAEPSKRP